MVNILNDFIIENHLNIVIHALWMGTASYSTHSFYGVFRKVIMIVLATFLHIPSTNYVCQVYYHILREPIFFPE